MHILQGALVLLLWLPAAAGAAASPFDRFPGEWGGTVASDDGCEWKVRASARNAGPGLSGNFTYDGDCAEEGGKRGDFSIKRTSVSCFTATVKVDGLPPIPMTGCSDKAGNINFKTIGFSGKLKISKNGNDMTLSVKAERGTADGQFKRMVKKKRGSGKAKARPEDGGGDDKNTGDDQKAAPEVLIGGY